jgi:hypothetical protein
VSPSAADRRSHPRQILRLAVRLVLGEDTEERSAEVLDLSEGGIRLRSPELALCADAALHLQVGRPDGCGTTALAHVVRSDEYGVALYFDTISEYHRALLATPGLWASADRVHVQPIDGPCPPLDDPSSDDHRVERSFLEKLGLIA